MQEVTSTENKNIPWKIKKINKKSDLPEWCLPGRRIVPTPRGSILHPSRASQVPYKAKNPNVADFGGVRDFAVFYSLYIFL